jgi:NADPH-dependent 2,4-dienoyl-CoA reductase/sulfur reductase-like enzyme
MATLDPRGVVIIGAGLAGYSVARALRASSPELPITLICADDGDFYSKPSLSVSASARASVTDLVSRRAAQMKEDLRCALLPRTHVTELDCEARVVLAANAVVPYDKLVLALGAESWLPPIPGLVRGPRIVSVNHLADYKELTDKLRPGARVAVLGAGFVGVELANDLARCGYAITLLDRAAEPLPALVPAAVGKRLRAALLAAGVTCRFGVRPLEVIDADRGVRLELEGETPLEADLLLCATGLCPTSLVRRSGLTLERGIRVDRQLRTSDPHVFALGDCASFTPYNLQFVAPIAHAAGTLARALLGMEAELTLPALAISVKTPCFPITSSAGARRDDYRWQVEEDESGITALAFDSADQLCAFALGGAHVSARSKYLSKLPPLLAAATQKGQS